MSKTIKNVFVYGLMAALAIAVAVLSTILATKSKPDGNNGAGVAFNYAYTNEKIGSGDVSVKYLSDNKCLVVNGSDVYWGTHQTKNDTSLITITEEDTTTASQDTTTSEKEETTKKSYTLKVSFLNDRAILDDISSKEKLIDSSIGLTKEEDAEFVNGLWKLKINFYEGEYTEASEDGHILKIDNDTIFGSDTSTDSGIMKLYKIGNKLYYEYVERDGKSHHYNLFYTEKAGTHCKEINEIGEFGDLIYTVEGPNERYYHELVKDTSLGIEETLKLSASIMSKRNRSTTNETPINVNSSLELNTDGTVKLSISGNAEYNIETTGNWYSIKTGVLIVTKDKGFFNGYFAVDLRQDINNSDGLSFIVMSDEYEYCISWNKA